MSAMTWAETKRWFSRVDDKIERVINLWPNPRKWPQTYRRAMLLALPISLPLWICGFAIFAMVMIVATAIVLPIMLAWVVYRKLWHGDAEVL